MGSDLVVLAIFHRATYCRFDEYLKIKYKNLHISLGKNISFDDMVKLKFGFINRHLRKNKS